MRLFASSASFFFPFLFHFFLQWLRMDFKHNRHYNFNVLRCCRLYFSPLLLLLLRAQKLCRPWMVYSYKVIMILIIVLVIVSDLYLSFFLSFFFFLSYLFCQYCRLSARLKHKTKPSKSKQITFIRIECYRVFAPLYHSAFTNFVSLLSLLVLSTTSTFDLCFIYHTRSMWGVPFKDYSI